MFNNVVHISRLSTEHHNNYATPGYIYISTENKFEWMSSSPETPVGRKRPRNRSVTQWVEEDSGDNFQHTQQQRAGREWSSIPDLTDNYSNED